MIATGGSVCSRVATNKKIELARLSGGTVYSVYVIFMEYFSSIAVDFNRERMHETLRKDGYKALKIGKGIGELENVKVKSILLEGHPAAELIRYAEEEKMNNYCYEYSWQNRNYSAVFRQRCWKHCPAFRGSGNGCKKV